MFDFIWITCFFFMHSAKTWVGMSVASHCILNIPYLLSPRQSLNLWMMLRPWMMWKVLRSWLAIKTKAWGWLSSTCPTRPCSLTPTCKMWPDTSGIHFLIILLCTGSKKEDFKITYLRYYKEVLLTLFPRLTFHSLCFLLKTSSFKKLSLLLPKFMLGQGFRHQTLKKYLEIRYNVHMLLCAQIIKGNWVHIHKECYLSTKRTPKSH